MYHSGMKYVRVECTMPTSKRIIVYLTTEQHVRKRMKEKGGMDAYDFILGTSFWNENINNAGKGCVFNSSNGITKPVKSVFCFVLF